MVCSSSSFIFCLFVCDSKRSRQQIDHRVAAAFLHLPSNSDDDDDDDDVFMAIPWAGEGKEVMEPRKGGWKER